MVRLFHAEGLEARRLLSTTTLAVFGDYSADDGTGPGWVTRRGRAVAARRFT